ncbi:MAG: hypothetical protein OWT28_04485 [Firmicutes bacterium]|nr:hypothetical protein [Bacillota bacterium]
MSDQKQDGQNANPAAGETNWSRRQFLIGSVGVLVGATAALFESSNISKAASLIVGTQVDSGATSVYQNDYYYIPDQMTWRVGTPMIVNLQNMSPVHFHEWMIGRGGFNTAPNVYTDLDVQFNEDFWDGVHVTILEANGVDNLAVNKAIVKLDVPKGPWLVTQPGSGNFSPTMRPGGNIKLQFTVPNKPGIWQYGCFVQGFVHYLDGMKGTINILPA